MKARCLYNTQSTLSCMNANNKKKVGCYTLKKKEGNGGNSNNYIKNGIVFTIAKRNILRSSSSYFSACIAVKCQSRETGTILFLKLSQNFTFVQRKVNQVDEDEDAKMRIRNLYPSQRPAGK